MTNKLIKIRQRDGSGTAKKLEESISTAPSGLFSASKRFQTSKISAIIMFLMPDAIITL
jgi:hypothetical protein